MSFKPPSTGAASMLSSDLYLFEIVAGSPIPILPFDPAGAPRVADGEKFLSLTQTSAKTGWTEARLRECYNATWRDYLPSEAVKITDPITPAAPVPLEAASASASAVNPIAHAIGAHVSDAFTRLRADVLRGVVYPHLSEEQFAYFIEACNQRRLNPWSGHLVAKLQWDAASETMSIKLITTIKGLGTIAHRTGLYAGKDGPWWCGPDGKWQEVWTADEPPVAAKVIVRRTDGSAWPAVARWKSYAPYSIIPAKPGEPEQRILDEFWGKMPEHMLGKCAHALALRDAFPDDLGDLYTFDEMAQAFTSRTPRRGQFTAPVSPRGGPARPARPAPIELEDGRTFVPEGFESQWCEPVYAANR